MGNLTEFFTPLHKRTRRDYLGRMADDKPGCMATARQYGPDYWDGDRRFGYGGYRYDGRWQPVAERIIAHYGLTDASSVLDVGCGKAHLLHEIGQLLPGARLAGFDISRHGLADAPPAIRPRLFAQAAEAPYPYPDKSFDLVLSLGCLHNLPVFDLAAALGEIERVGRRGFVMVESYRNERELFHLQCWALTCRSFFEPAEWTWLFERFGYTGDYEFIYFE